MTGAACEPNCAADRREHSHATPTISTHACTRIVVWIGGVHTVYKQKTGYAADEMGLDLASVQKVQLLLLLLSSGGFSGQALNAFFMTKLPDRNRKTVVVVSLTSPSTQSGSTLGEHRKDV